jgi:hypothetical protein
MRRAGQVAFAGHGQEITQMMEVQRGHRFILENVSIYSMNFIERKLYARAATTLNPRLVSSCKVCSLLRSRPACGAAPQQSANPRSNR